MHGNTKTNRIRSGLKATTVTSQAAVLCRELYFSATNKIIYLRSLRQGVQISNFEEKIKTKQKQKKQNKKKNKKSIN